MTTKPKANAGGAGGKSTTLEIQAPNTADVEVCILGTSPLIYNAMSEKAKHELLLPRRKTKADKEQNLKHEPIKEYRGSMYVHRGDTRPTRLYFPAGGFKKGMMGASLDLPGATKAATGRLVWIVGDKIDIYGVPQILMAITRSADMNRTPDMRTRAILTEWACKITVRFASPTFGSQQILNLLNAAGVFMGLGDWRQEKGSGNFGQFKIVNEDDPRFLAVIKNGGRKEQDAAIDTPLCYDEESSRLLEWYNAEIKSMGDRVNAMSRSNGRATVGAA